MGVKAVAGVAVDGDGRQAAPQTRRRVGRAGPPQAPCGLLQRRGATFLGLALRHRCLALHSCKWRPCAASSGARAGSFHPCCWRPCCSCWHCLPMWSAASAAGAGAASAFRLATAALAAVVPGSLVGAAPRRRAHGHKGEMGASVFAGLPGGHPAHAGECCPCPCGCRWRHPGGDPLWWVHQVAVCAHDAMQLACQTSSHEVQSAPLSTPCAWPRRLWATSRHPACRSRLVSSGSLGYQRWVSTGRRGRVVQATSCPHCCCCCLPRTESVAASP